MRKITFFKILGLVLGDIAIIFFTFFLGMRLIAKEIPDPFYYNYYSGIH